MDKLKPCPFCGESKTIVGGGITMKDSYAICCTGCGASVGEFHKPEFAQIAWNTRADDQRTVKLLEALEAEIVARRNSIRVWSLNEFLPVLEAIVEEYKQAEKESPN